MLNSSSQMRTPRNVPGSPLQHGFAALRDSIMVLKVRARSAMKHTAFELSMPAHMALLGIAASSRAGLQVQLPESHQVSICKDASTHSSGGLAYLARVVIHRCRAALRRWGLLAASAVAGICCRAL